jgi:hypothetical protein
LESQYPPKEDARPSNNLTSFHSAPPLEGFTIPQYLHSLESKPLAHGGHKGDISPLAEAGKQAERVEMLSYGVTQKDFQASAL